MRSLDSRGKVVVLGFLFFLAWIFPVWGRQNLTSNSNDSLKVGDKLVSPSSQFELEIKFFERSQNHFLCIHYSADFQETVVWVHREQPLTDKSILKIEEGKLQLRESNGNNPLWNSSTTTGSVAMLLDTGNLVLVDANETPVWESFNYSITDTLLPDQEMVRTDVRRNSLTSWASKGDPSSGKYIFDWGNATLYDGTTVPNVLRLKCNTCKVSNATEAVYIPGRDVDSPHIISNADSVYFHKEMGGLYYSPTVRNPNASLPPAPTVILSDFQQRSNTTVKRLTLDRDGGLRIWEWQIDQWTPVANWVVTERGSQCYAMGTCGDFSLCKMTPSASLGLVQCTCPDGFDPKPPTDPLTGCNRRSELIRCPADPQNFTMVKLERIDMPWGGDLDQTKQPDLDTCTAFCLQECDCTGVVYSQAEGLCWRKNSTLYNLGYPTEVTHGNDRVTHLKISKIQPEGKKDSRLWIIAPVVGGVFAAGISVFCICWFRGSLRRICGGVCTKDGSNNHGIPERFGGPENAPPQELVSH